MQILSINVSKSVSVDYKGKEVKTGIYKRPVTGPVYVGSNTIEGDIQADLKNHGGPHKAVYAYPAEHYEYWSKELNRDDLLPGHFGENLTVAGLAESNCFIGSRYRVNNVCLEVAQPRIPCFKMNIKFEDSSMMKNFIRYGNTGVYFRVVQEGHIQVNEVMELVSEPNTKVSIGELFHAYFNEDDKNSKLAVFERALDVAELAPVWKEMLERKLASKNA